jgi:hypothetical protein
VAATACNPGADVPDGGSTADPAPETADGEGVPGEDGTLFGALDAGASTDADGAALLVLPADGAGVVPDALGRGVVGALEVAGSVGTATLGIAMLGSGRLGSGSTGAGVGVGVAVRVGVGVGVGVGIGVGVGAAATWIASVAVPEIGVPLQPWSRMTRVVQLWDPAVNGTAVIENVTDSPTLSRLPPLSLWTVATDPERVPNQSLPGPEITDTDWMVKAAPTLTRTHPISSMPSSDSRLSLLTVSVNAFG